MSHSIISTCSGPLRMTAGSQTFLTCALAPHTEILARKRSPIAMTLSKVGSPLPVTTTCQSLNLVTDPPFTRAQLEQAPYPNRPAHRHLSNGRSPSVCKGSVISGSGSDLDGISRLTPSLNPGHHPIAIAAFASLKSFGFVRRAGDGDGVFDHLAAIAGHSG